LYKQTKFVFDLAQQRLSFESVRGGVSAISTSFLRKIDEQTKQQEEDTYILRKPVVYEEDGASVTEKELNFQTRMELFPFFVVFFLSSLMAVFSQSVVPLEVAGGVEFLWLSYCNALALILSKPAVHKEWPLDRPWSEMWRAILGSVKDPRVWFASWWLNDTKFDEITREDAEEFLSWAMYGTVIGCLSPKQEVEIAQSVDLIEHYCHHSFPARALGARPLKSMRSTIEPMKWFPKPLAFYGVTQGLFGLALSQELKKFGFEEGQANSFKYWHRRGNAVGPLVEAHSGRSTMPPIVFFHGVGGMPAYANVLKGLSAFGVPVIGVEMNYVSLHMAPSVPSIDEHVAAFEKILNDNGYEKAIIIGHSWGTNVMSWLVQSVAHRIESAVFCDPVCFMLHLRDITFNWFYAKSEATNKLEKEEEPLVTVAGIVSLVQTELCSVNTIARNVVWARNILWPAEIENTDIDTLVLCSTEDHIVPSLAIVDQMANHIASIEKSGLKSNIQQKTLVGADHGGLVFDSLIQKQALEIIGLHVERAKSRHLTSLKNNNVFDEDKVAN